MPKFLILGGNGLLGASIKDVFTNKFDFYAPTREELDLLKENDLMNFLKSNTDFDFVLNCAGYNDVDGAESSRSSEIECMNLNVKLPELVAKCLLDYNPKCKIVQFSSDYVFNGESSLGYSEEDPKDPLSIYGLSKSLGEEAVMKNNPNSSVVRISWLFGEHKANFISKIFDKFSEGGSLNVVDDQFGKPTYTHDVADFLLNNFDLLENNIYHLPNETVYSWYDLAKFALDIKQKSAIINPIKSFELKQVAKRPMNSILMNNLLPKLREGSRAVMEYVNKNML